MSAKTPSTNFSHSKPNINFPVCTDSSIVLFLQVDFKGTLKKNLNSIGIAVMFLAFSFNNDNENPCTPFEHNWNIQVTLVSDYKMLIKWVKNIRNKRVLSQSIDLGKHLKRI